MKLSAIVFDCRDAATLAAFWSSVLDVPVADGATAEFAQLTGEPAWSFTAVPEPKSTKNRLHVDLEAAGAEAEAEVTRVMALGATRLGDFDEEGFRWTTLADPEGNEFDIAAA